MATLLLQAAGAVVGTALGGPFGAVIGGALGATAGALVDQRLFGSGGRHVEGPRLSDLAGVTSTEGAPIPRVYGRARIGGQAIWATRFQEVATTEREGSSGGKGGSGGATTTRYSYFVDLAIGLCEGPIAMVRRVWADGKELDLTTVTMRLHRGDPAQTPDPLIVAKQGESGAPAYRGLAYVLFERLALEPFGNRVPQFSFEVARPLSGLASWIRGVDLIPGASEFAYATGLVRAVKEEGVTAPENRHQLTHETDWTASLDALQALCPNLTSVALVVSWFGDDLRCGHCSIAPRVEIAAKETTGGAWSVAGLERGAARVVSAHGGAPAYGGTPSDASVIAAISDLKARGLSVVFYPFVMMDVAAGNALSDPWTGAAGQPAYPWRGRITCDPAPGRAGSPDGAAAAAAQVAAFFGSTSPGAEEWSLRRFVLHCADLCVAAGGVDAFLVGSELAALTRVRSASGVYPAALALAALAGDVKARLGAGTKASYAADWTEYGAHVLDGGAEVRFPLDVVWGAASVDFVGLDVYWPLSDWRDGTAHRDAQAARSIYDRGFLAARQASGEGFDWHYASSSDRAAQTRSTIVDGAYGKPWTFRVKDLIGWWSNAHIERVGGVELGATTAWSPMSKPIWIVETGCPAVDRGANGPNVFPDPKSSESALPPFSRGAHDDLMQVAALESTLIRFDPFVSGHAVGSNPISPVYGGLMVDPFRIHGWAWDARPFPAFPLQTAAWADAENWRTGHWLTSRIEGAPLDRLVGAILADSGAAPAAVDLVDLDGFVDGYVVDRTMSARAAIEPLAALFGFDAKIAGGRVGFARRGGARGAALSADDLVPERDGALFTLSRAPDSELPNEAALSFSDGERDYRTLAVSSRRLEGASRRESRVAVAATLQRPQAKQLVDVWLQDLWVAREAADFTARPGLVALEIGDSVTLPVEGGSRLYRIESIADGAARRMRARAVEPAIYETVAPRLEPARAASPAVSGPLRVVVLDLAVDRDGRGALQHLAVAGSPWPGEVAVYSDSGAGFRYERGLTRAAILGATLGAMPPGPAGRLDHATTLDVRLSGGALQSVDDSAMLAGRNVMALRGDDGAWEMFGFARAELIAERTWRLSRLLRGLGGEETLASRAVAAGATIVLLDEAVISLSAGLSALGVARTYRIGPARRDHGDSSYVEVAPTPTAKALQPYAPVRVRATREAGGVALAFTRRGRRDADGWEALDIPLGEDGEAYAIEILSGGTALRTLTTGTPSALYAAADELADFGAPRTSLDLRVTQLSPTVGRGFALEASVAVR